MAKTPSKWEIEYKRLRKNYLAYLKRHGLEGTITPRKVPKTITEKSVQALEREYKKIKEKEEAKKANAKQKSKKKTKKEPKKLDEKQKRERKEREYKRRKKKADEWLSSTREEVNKIPPEERDSLYELWIAEQYSGIEHIKNYKVEPFDKWRAYRKWIDEINEFVPPEDEEEEPFPWVHDTAEKKSEEKDDDFIEPPKPKSDEPDDFWDEDDIAGNYTPPDFTDDDFSDLKDWFDSHKKPTPKAEDLTLLYVEGEIFYWSPDPNWSEFFADVKNRDRNTAANALNGAIDEFGRDVIAKRLAEHASEIHDMLDKILYGSDGRKGGISVQDALSMFVSILNGRLLSPEEAMALTEDYDNPDEDI